MTMFDQIAALKNALKPEPISVEYQGTKFDFLIKSIDFLDSQKVTQQMFVLELDGDEEKITYDRKRAPYRNAQIIALSITDVDGNLAFTFEQALALPREIADPLIAASLRFNGYIGKPVEEAAKNSSPTQNGATSS